LFIIDPANEMTAIAEGRKIGIPIVAVCDTNSDPDLIDYPIPGNDDAIRAIRLITNLVAEAVIQGRQQQSQEEMEQLTNQPLEDVDTPISLAESESLSSPTL
jgi:small subunit ribosomal protein S2